MEALARGAQAGLMAAAAIVVFAAVLWAVFGVIVALAAVIETIWPDESEEEESEDNANG